MRRNFPDKTTESLNADQAKLRKNNRKYFPIMFQNVIIDSVFLFVAVYGRLDYMEKLNKNISFYSIIIEACEEGGYFAYCPTLQGCHAEGETYGEVIDNIREVIEAHLKLRKKHKELVSFVKIKNMSNMNIQIPIPVRN